MPTPELTDTDRALLRVAAAHAPGHIPGPLARRIREDLGLSTTQYTQRLLALLRSPEGTAAAPTLARQWHGYLDHMAAARGETRP
ncbi:hypothetical protein GCM10009801_73340 [Streptomyces albiaxialis]|uniref:Uncharacterized protein n=1 Tax=Streptomyces albiaxialis TaxID=329523 RepID=A0ABN2WWW1_9ACTN